MSEIVGLAQVEQSILRISDTIEQVTHAVRKRAEAAAAADTAYDIAYAKALLSAREDGGTVDECKARATVACATELTERNIAQALYESAREAGRNYRAQLDGLRSVNTNVRAVTVG